MTRLLKSLVIGFCIIGLMACGTFHNRAKNYQEAKASPMLKVPAGLTTFKFPAKQPYLVPGASEQTTSTVPNPIPPGFDRQAVLLAGKK